MVTNSEEIDLTLRLSLDKPHAQNAEKFPTTLSSSSSPIGGDMSKSPVGNEARGDSAAPSLYKPCSLPLKAEKIEFEDLQTMGRPKNGERFKNVNKFVNVKGLVLQKQNKVGAANRKKEKSPGTSPRPPVPALDRLEVPSELVASVSKNPALIRALAQINEDFTRLQDLKHKGARGMAKGGATSKFQRSPKTEKDPMIPSEWTVKEEMPETMSGGNPLKMVKLEHPYMLTP